MLATRDEILAAVKALDYDARWELVEDIEATLHPPPGPPMTEGEFAAMLQRRSDELDRGLVQAIPWEVVKAEARKRVGLPPDE